MRNGDHARFPVTFDNETVTVGTASDLAVVLDVLQGNHDRQVLEQLGPNIQRIITDPVGFMSTLKALAPKDQLLLIDAIAPRLSTLLPSAGHLRDVLALLAETEVEERLLHALGSRELRRLLPTADQLSEVLEWVYGRNDQLVLDLLGRDHLLLMLGSGRDLSVVLLSVDKERQEWLLEAIGWEKISSIVRTGLDLAYLLRALPSELSDRILREYSREQLVTLIGNRECWESLCHRLEASELSHICAILGVTIDA